MVGAVDWPDTLTLELVLDVVPIYSSPRSRVRDRQLTRVFEKSGRGRSGATATWIVGLLVDRHGPEAIYPFAEVLAIEPGGVLMTAIDFGRAPTLAVVAGRYLSVYGQSDLFDLENSEIVTAGPDDWIETRVYNIRTLVKTCLSQIGADRPRQGTPP